jgi:hypothetical protein
VRSEAIRLRTRLVNNIDSYHDSIKTEPINIMALGKKAYPKATVKKIIKAHSDHNLKKNADVTVGFSGLVLGYRNANAYVPQDLSRLCPLHGNVGQSYGATSNEYELTFVKTGERGCNSI